MKQEFVRQIEEQWVSVWASSPRQERLQEIDTSFPFEAYRKHQYNLKRAHTSLIVQVRTGHFPLNKYLHRIRKSDTNTCQLCHISLGEERPPESVMHFLFECSVHTDLRQTLATKLGQGNFNLHDIMNDAKRMKALANFIIKTERLQDVG